MTKYTPLYDDHLASGAKMVDFAGWSMPINYGSQLAEHHRVRTDAGMFDVSHMTIVDITGNKAKAFLKRLLANNVGKLKTPGSALYTLMLNESGGVLDDLIVYKTTSGYRTVLNSATREKDLAWMRDQAAGLEVELSEQNELAMLAVQGPQALTKAAVALGGQHGPIALQLQPFQGLFSADWFIARTGYTGEDGLEIMLPASQVAGLWQRLLEVDVLPCGLGARDTLRLEAGMHLYGQDLDEATPPHHCGLRWTVAFEPDKRAFIGRAALAASWATAGQPRMVGLLLAERGVMRAQQQLFADPNGEPAGIITSGTFSPTLNCSIALARVSDAVKDSCFVAMRSKMLTAKVVRLPFVRHGKQRV